MNLKLIIITIIIVAIIVAGTIYLVSIKRSGVSNTTGSVNQPSSVTQKPQNNSHAQVSQNPVSDTTTDILNDLKRIPDDSALNHYMNFLNQSLQNF